MIRVCSVLLRLVVPRVSLRVNADSRHLSGRKCHRGLVVTLGSPVFPWLCWSHSQLGRRLTQTGEHFSSRDSLNPRSSLGRTVLKSLLHKTYHKPLRDVRGVYAFGAAALTILGQAHLRVGTIGHIHMKFCIHFTGLVVP